MVPSWRGACSRAMWGQADAGSRLTRIPKASINRRRQASTSGPGWCDSNSPRSLAPAAGPIHLAHHRKTKIQGSKEDALEYTVWKPGATLEHPAHSGIKSKNRKSDEGKRSLRGAL